MAFALVVLLISVATESLTGLTCCRSSLLLGRCYSARFEIVGRVRVRVGIQHSLPLGRLWTGGLEGGCRSTLEPGQRPSHDYR